MNIEQINAKLSSLEKKSKDTEEKERIFELKKKVKGIGPDAVISSYDYIKENNSEEIEYKAFTGLKILDSLIGGFRPGTLNIISGLTKQGKTTFCQTMTVNFLQQGLKSLWFSLDTPPIELIERFEKVPEFYLPRENFLDKKIDWIEDKIIDGLANYDTKIIFIDNLEFLAIYEKTGENYANQLGTVIIKLKQLAMKYNVIIFLNHHIRSIEEGKKPVWQDLKDSSGISHHSDSVFMVWRDMIKTPEGNVFDPTIGFISLQLQRRGGRTGIVKVENINNIFYEFRKKKTLEL